jgi:glucans biosynthesis protein
MHQSIGIRLENLRRAPRCGAMTRARTPCECPAIRGRARCRMHGGRSPGAPRGLRNGNYRTGDHTLEAREERQWLSALVTTCIKSEGMK